MKRALAVGVAFLMLLSIGQVGAASAERTGWCLIETEYLVPDGDTDVNGPYRDSLMGGATMWNYLQDAVADHSVVIDQYRTDDGGGVLARARWRVEWEEPATFFPAGEHASITVTHIVLAVEPWDSPGVCAAIDAPGLEMGQGTYARNIFHQPNGGFDGTVDTSTVVHGDREVMTAQEPLAEGGAGSLMALYIDFGAGYGMRYTYAWGAEAAHTGAGQDALTWGGAATPAPFPASPFDGAGKAESEVLWTNRNGSAAENGAQSYYAFFELKSDAVVTSFRTYHLGGAEPGELMLYAESGSQWGPFRATGAEEQGGVKNGCWIADTGALELPAGRYAVADSDPKTWSCNAESGYEGFLEVRGQVPGAAFGVNPFASATRAPEGQPAPSQENLIGLWLSEPMESGEQMLLNVSSASTLELIYCTYLGDGPRGTERLTDANWTLTDALSFGYALAGGALRLSAGDGDPIELGCSLIDPDTVLLSETNRSIVLHRASREQAAAFESWSRSPASPEETPAETKPASENDTLERQLIGLWLSDPMDGEARSIMDIAPDGTLGVYNADYGGGVDAGAESLLDGANWTFIASGLCDYRIEGGIVLIDNWVSPTFNLVPTFPGKDVLHMTDEYDDTLVLHRATPEQEASFRSWGWPCEYWGERSPQESAEPDPASSSEGATDAWFCGLWLSEPYPDGEQEIMYVGMDNALEIYYCYHGGDRVATVENLLEDGWECMDSLVCGYVLSPDSLSLYTGTGTETVLTLSVRDGDTLELTDEYGYVKVMHRATRQQEDAWLGLSWRDGYETGYDGEFGGEIGAPEERLIGLWLSEPDEDGNYSLVYALPDLSLEWYPCFRYGGSPGSLDNLGDGNWEFVGPEVFAFEATADSIALVGFYDAEYAVSRDLSFWDDDTMEMSDPDGADPSCTGLFHRATPEQEEAWLGWLLNQ